MKKAPLLLLLFTLSYPIPGAIGDVIHYWRFEEGAGFTTADSTGGIAGDLLGFNEFTGWSPSVPLDTIPLTGEANNYSLRFNIGFVDISTPQPLNLGTTFTIEFFYHAEMPVIVSPFFAFANGATLWALLGESDANLLHAINFQGSMQVSPASLLVLNQWQHYALVKEPGKYSIYIDGQIQFSGLLPDGTDGPYDFLGEPESGTRTIGEGFRGYIDEFRISNTALSPSEFLNIPEPGTLGLLALGGLAFWAAHRHRRILPRCPP
jgi:hypothetical protein